MPVPDFNQALGRLTGSLGDPTRRAIYLTVRESDDEITAARVADLFGIHPNVARHHLDRLVADGYLRVRDRDPARPAGVGRPPRVFEATEDDVAVSYPARRHDLLAELLVRVVKRLAPEEGPRVAEEVGQAYGEELAAAIGLPTEQGFAPALAAVARALTGAGFEITADLEAGRLVAGACPFGRTAADHPEVVCRLDLGIVKGLMAAAGAPARRVVITPRRRPNRPCVAS
ncbi:MAG: helix-turn-helix domain-containing protein [Actinobacteria bacterium]|nr:helix-turn-helix domain-containing protein [Actinomycetota bacterium]